MNYVAYGCDGYAGDVKPALNIVHSMSMFDVNMVKLARNVEQAAVVDQHTTQDPDGDTWVTTRYSNMWVKVEYTAGDQGVHEFCLYAPATPEI